jgi:hypothetical protein
MAPVDLAASADVYVASPDRPAAPLPDRIAEHAELTATVGALKLPQFESDLLPEKIAAPRRRHWRYVIAAVVAMTTIACIDVGIPSVSRGAGPCVPSVGNPVTVSTPHGQDIVAGSTAVDLDTIRRAVAANDLNGRWRSHSSARANPVCVKSLVGGGVCARWVVPVT